MALSIGTTLNQYEITGVLGAGGMGEVYRARDTKLGRDVAIKVLPQEMASDSQRLRRFEQEARAASALNHPNIITIYEIGDHEGTPYIAMEYVEGKTLRELLAGGPLPNDKLLRYATQMAEGLAKAHQAGIVHRDLKPENIVISEDGYVKILDFGLAKLMPSRVDSEMQTVERTKEGVIVGTVSYMSPEQAAGGSVDYRSDQFSLGCILYEMATGKLAFPRDTAAEILTAIIREEPEPMTLANPEVSAGTARVINRCLAKDPKDRYDSTGDIAKDIHWEELAKPEQPSRRHPLAAVGAVGVLAIVLVMILGLFASDIRNWVAGSPDSPRIDSIAVLPLENLSGDAEQEYFADGMTEALITNLAKIGALKVISRSSSMRFKGTNRPLAEIARELDVDAVLEGSALRAEGRVRITAQLIDPKGDRTLWAESYERDFRDVLTLQSEVARAVADAIHVRVAPDEAALLDRKHPVNAEALEAFLRAKHFANQVPEGAQKAIEYYRLVLEKDPAFAEAYAGMAVAHHVLGTFGFMEPRQAYAQAKADALKALELDENLAEAHAALAIVAHSYDWDWSVAKREYERAIDLDPNNREARRGYGELLYIMGRSDEGLAQALRVWELDPLSVYSGAALASSYYYSRYFDDTIEFCQKTLELDKDASVIHWLLWLSFHQKGMHSEAVTAYANYVYAEVLGSQGLSEGRTDLERTHLQEGYLVAMRIGAKELERQWDLSSRWDPLTIALSHVHAETNDEAFRWLQLAYERREPALPVLLRAAPDFDPLSSDPRFQDLLRRMNFPE